ncbi:MAG: ATP-binding protein [bacterium]|nr:ATP-binding protein [bacterium]
MNFESILLFITSFINLFLGIFVWTKNVKGELNKSFALLASAISLWGFGLLTMSLVPQEYKLFALNYCVPVLHLGLVFIPSSFFNFVISITKNKSHVNIIFCYFAYTLSLTFIILGRIGLFDPDVSYVFGSYRVVGGTANPLFAIFFMIVVIYGIYLLYKKYLTTESSLEKNRLRYLIVGLYIALLCSVSNFLRVVGVIQVYPMAHIGTLFLNIMITMAIIKYRLMDITVIIQKGLVYSLLTALITGLWLSGIFTFETILHIQSLFARLLTLMLIMFIFQPLRERIQLIIDKMFYRERHDLQQLLKKTTKEFTTMIETETLLLSVLTVIMEAIHPKYAVLMLLDESSDGYKPKFGIGNYNKSILIKQDEPIVRWFNKEKRELLHEEIMENPEFNGLRDDVLKAVETMNSMLSVPLFFKDKLVGILNLGSKLSEKPYNHDEMLFLTTLSDEIGIALENTVLYTDLKRYTIELEKKTHELQISNEAKSNFLKIVSHELRTPLTVILGYTGLLSSKALVGEAQERGIKIMEEKCRHLNELIGDILDLSKIERGEVYEFNKQPVDLKKIIEEVTLIWTPESQKKNIVLQSEIPQNFPLIMYDHELAEEIFSKLVDNAIKFIKKDSGGKVTIRVEDKGNFLEGCVEDTGIGIKKENFEKIFERFYQIDMSDTRAYEGTGLGLAIVKEIIEQSGGGIKVESAVGQGSKFIFTLPKEEVTGELPEIGLKGKSPEATRILIVEDKEDILGLAELYLKSNGYKIETAQNGVTALEKLYAQKPDLVIYGLKVPKVDGYEIGHILRNHEDTKNIPLLMLVPVEEEKNLDKIYKSGATTHLFKPFDFKDLMEKVTRLV